VTSSLHSACGAPPWSLYLVPRGSARGCIRYGLQRYGHNPRVVHMTGLAWAVWVLHWTNPSRIDRTHEFFCSFVERYGREFVELVAVCGEPLAQRAACATCVQAGPGDGRLYRPCPEHTQSGEGPALVQVGPTHDPEGAT
jgi:hypothetical protein